MQINTINTKRYAVSPFWHLIECSFPRKLQLWFTRASPVSSAPLETSRKTWTTWNSSTTKLILKFQSRRLRSTRIHPCLKLRQKNSIQLCRSPLPTNQPLSKLKRKSLNSRNPVLLSNRTTSIPQSDPSTPSSLTGRSRLESPRSIRRETGRMQEVQASCSTLN